MKIVLDLLAFIPTRAHEYDAGLDLYSASDDVYIYPGESELFDTGVHVQLPKNTVGFLKSKSGLNVKHGITSEGVIDVGYTGSIMVKLYNHGSKPYKVCSSSLILKFYFWIEMRKLNSSVVSRKMPRNTFLCEISFLRPSRKNLVQVLNRWNTDIQKALNSKRGQLNFSHIQP